MRVIESLNASWRGMAPARRRWITGLAAGVLMPIASAVIAGSLDHYLGVRAPSMTFLCSVILAALWFGRGVALVTALFAFFIYNFYLVEPRNTFGFAGFEDALTLLVFVGTALLIGGLAGTLHDERERARDQVRLLSGLFAASRSMAECDSADSAGQMLTESVRYLAADEAALLQMSEDADFILIHAAPTDVALPPAVADAAQTLARSGDTDAHVSGWRLRRLETNGPAASVLAWKPLKDSNEEHAIAVRLLLELTLVAIARQRNLERQVELDAFEATERLRTALMSSISHDFRTPLSIILASSSSLLAYGDQFSSATRADLLASIQEEAERLNRFVGNILNMTRLETGVVQLRSEWIDPVELLDNIEDRIQKRLANRKFSIISPAAVPAIFVDPILLEQALINVVENALVHAPNNCHIRIGADYTVRHVRLWVDDDGPGVPADDLPSIFDKFHRLGQSRHSQGAGLGLAISKGFVEAMQGTATASRSGSGGLRIEFVFPLQIALSNA
ncbi:MAG: sensor histidine kinase [Caulobacteraceae bacterium]